MKLIRRARPQGAGQETGRGYWRSKSFRNRPECWRRRASAGRVLVQLRERSFLVNCFSNAMHLLCVSRVKGVAGGSRCIWQECRARQVVPAGFPSPRYCGRSTSWSFDRAWRPGYRSTEFHIQQIRRRRGVIATGHFPIRYRVFRFIAGGPYGRTSRRRFHRPEHC